MFLQALVVSLCDSCPVFLDMFEDGSFPQDKHNTFSFNGVALGSLGSDDEHMDLDALFDQHLGRFGLEDDWQWGNRAATPSPIRSRSRSRSPMGKTVNEDQLQSAGPDGPDQIAATSD